MNFRILTSAQLAEEDSLKKAGIPIPDSAKMKKSFTIKAPTDTASSLGILLGAQAETWVWVYVFVFSQDWDQPNYFDVIVAL